jgi:DNA-binding IclR family transcriptional regulator
MSDTNGSVTKALDALDLLGRAGQAVRLKDLAAELDWPESSTHRLLASLASRGYVRQQGPGGAYHLGWKVAILARSLGLDAHLVQDLRPYLQKLVRQVDRTVNLAVLNELQVMYLDCVTPNQRMTLYVTPGATLPASCTALGKALLAHLPHSQLENALARLHLEAFTPQTITSVAEFRRTLGDVRRRGYAVDDRELKPDVMCLAAPIIDASGLAVAAVSVTTPVTELQPNWEAETAPRIVAVSREAARDLYGGVHK